MMNHAGCTELYMDRNNICAGTSVLNDDIIPDLDGVNTSNSAWASLFTLSGTRGITSLRLSFEVDNETLNHDHIELAVRVQLSRDEYRLIINQCLF